MSTAKRIAAIFVIFAGATCAWMVLGATIFSRTTDFSESLSSKVASNWGSAQTQSPAAASWTRETRRPEETEDEDGKKHIKTVTSLETVQLPLNSTRAKANLQLEYRQKGLLWYSTYKVDFNAEYAFTNSTPNELLVTYSFPLPAEQAMYDDVKFLLDGVPVDYHNEANAISFQQKLAPGKSATLSVGYRSQGLGRWNYQFSQQLARVRDFQLSMTTNFKDIDFPDNTLSPTEKRETADGWQLQWEYKNLLSGYQIGMAMPEKLQPGPLAGKISFFAPVSLFFFFFLVFIITTIRRTDLHPMNYFFLAAAFFAFHLLMAYLVDHISIHAAFAISAVVSLLLVVSYMRLVAGARFAIVECGLAQLVYLVLFSYAFFFKGFTGLAITIGAIITLFVVMQLTGRINWQEKFARDGLQPAQTT